MVDSKILKGILSICILLIIIFVVLLVKDKIKYSNYNSVQAEITKVETVHGKHNDTNMTRDYYITYKYSIENKEYTSKKQVFTKSGKTVGDVEEIKYNPNDFLDIENTLLTNTYRALIIFLIIFSTLLGIVIFKREEY